MSERNWALPLLLEVTLFSVHCDYGNVAKTISELQLQMFIEVGYNRIK